MRLKQFIFALVAMLSFAFSGFAQTVVTDAAGLKNAVSSTGAVVTLGDNITVAEAISIPKGITVTLDLNGKSITGTHSGYVFAVAGTLNINDSQRTGTVTGKSSVLHVQGGGNITLNAGTIYRNSGLVVYTTGRFVVNGGSVKTATTTGTLSASNSGVRVAGSGTIQLNGGTVTSLLVSAGNLNITGSDAKVEGGINVTSAKGVNITAGDIDGNVTIADGAKSAVSVSGGNFEDAEAIEEFLPDGSTLLDKGDGTFEIVAGLLKIGDTYYPTLAAALAAAQDGETIELINQEGSVIAMNGSLYGNKSVTITGTAKVDWNKGFLFVGRGGAGNATLTFDNAQLTSASNSSSYGIHVSGREKNTADKYDGTLVIKNSTIELDYLINKGAMTLDNSSLTVKNGFDLNGRPAKETENGEDANATLALTNGSKLVVNNHNGMGIGREGKGELTVDATSTFEHTQDFLVCANGTMDVKGTLVSNGKKLTNNGEVKFTATKLTDATIEGTGTTRFYNDVNFYGANSITTGINGTPFHLVVNEGANLFITRFVLGYDRNITVNGTIADASAFNPEGQTPSLKFNSTSGVSVGGTGTGNLTVKNAYIELGSSSWKNAQGTYDWDFVNSYVSATSFTNATGADAATWDVTFDNSVLAAKNYIKNGKNVTYNFVNNSRGTTGSLRIDGVLNIDATSSVVTTSQQNNKVGAVDEHGGINGTVNVAGNLTIGSNSKTQLEVLGGTVNVKEGATLALGNNTMTLDAASAMQSAGNISGAITAADGANVAISGGTYTQDVTDWCTGTFIAKPNGDGTYGVTNATAVIGTQKFASLQATIDAVKNGETITLIADVAENVTVVQAPDVKFTIDGAQKTMNGTITVDGKSEAYATAGVTIKNVKFNATGIAADACINLSDGTTATRYTNNVTVENCTFTGGNQEKAAIKSYQGGDKNLTVTGCAVDNTMHSLIQAANIAGVVVDGCTVESKNGINLNSSSNVEIKNSTIDVNGYAVRAGVSGGSSGKIELANNTLKTNSTEDAVIVIRGTASEQINLAMSQNVVSGTTHISGTTNKTKVSADANYWNGATAPVVAEGNAPVNVNSYYKDEARQELVRIEMGSIYAYVYADRIFGDVTTNAANSLVVEIIGADGNVIGKSTLEKPEYRDGTMKTLTWRINFGADDSGSWAMQWNEGAPSINNIPAKVRVMVDGKPMAEAAIKYTANGDGQSPVVAAKNAADGKFSFVVAEGKFNLDTAAETLNAAIAAGDNVAILAAGTYNVPTGKNLTITGAVDGVQFGPIAEPNLGMKNYTFNNVTFNYANDSHYKGLQYAGEMEYNNCTFNGQVFLYGQKETFNKCTFNQTTNNYNVWTYSAKEVAFNECTFNSAGKSVLIYAESASVTNNVTVTKSQFNASQAVDGKAAIEMDASLTAGINLTIDAATTANGFANGNVSGNSLWNNKKGNADDANNDITVKVGDETVLAPVYEAQIGEKNYRNFQDAINAVKNGETITMLLDVTANVTLTEKVGLHYTIDGAGKQFKGSISVNSLSDTNDNRRITIKNIKFVDDSVAKVDFITSVNTNHYPRLTVEGCTFTGSGDATDVALRLKSSHSVVITNCTGTGLHSFLQNTSGWNLTIDNVKVTESKSAFALGTVQGVTIKGCEATVEGYGIRLDANTYNNNAVIEGNNVTAFIPVVVRSVNTQSNVTFTGENTFTAENTDGKWMVIGKDEYEAGKELPAETAEGNVVVALNGNGLGYEGIHGAGLAGEGTAEKPYLINNVAELEIFRNSVNAGSAKYSKPGLCVALNADIDMTGVNWVGIGTATAEHGFMGNFDGKNFKIKNLTITNPALDSDGYAYAGLFGVTEGTDKDNQNTIKNLTIENVTINTTGDIVSAAIAYPYYTNVDNVKVCGDIKIKGGKYTAGVLAYTRRCVNASNLSIVGNDGSYVEGTQTVGGVISDIQMNGGLTAVYSNFSAEGIKVTGEKSVGGIAGIIATQTLNGAAVKNVTLDSTDEFAGVVAGRLGGTSTISNVVSENVTGATAVIGATYDGAKAVEARIGDTYYSAFADAYTAAKANETVTMLTDLTMSEILVINKAITLDGNGKKLTSTAGRAINVDCDGNVGIKNLTINASGERAINVINKPANVTIEGVTATAANYTVNVAASAGAAKVAITGSNLTGLNVVNVTAPGAEVTINGGTITCNDQTDAEYYAALNLTKEAVGAKIAATSDVTFDIKGDSKKASNGAVDGVITIGGSTDEVDVIVAYIQYGNYYNSYTSIEAAIAKAKDGETIGLIRDITASDIITINKAITLDGNGKKLTSTAGRAINVSGADGVTIKNLTINASGERAINVIQNATNVTIEKVTATAKNYTVNVAASAPNAVVAINNSTLNGLCTVNVSAAGANVTVDNSTVNCNDNNTTAGEAYAALCLNKEAVGGSIVATNTTVNVAAGSDSMKGRNGAENGTVTINGSTDGVAVMVAVITYEGSVYYHSFSSLAEAVEFAKAGDVITLIRDITTSAQININKNVAIDGCNKKLTVNAARGFQITGGTVAISNLTIDMPNAAEGNRGINLYNGDTNAALDVTLNNVTINGGKAYAVNIGGGKDNKLTINGSTLTGYAAINVHTSSVNHTIVVDGSTLNGKNHNNDYSFGTVVVDGTNAHSLTITNTTITTENLEGVTSKYDKVVVSANCTLNWDGGEAAVRSIWADSKKGKLYYTDLQKAINDAAEVSGTVQILGNITATKSIAIPAAKKVTIDLNGKTITGTDNETKSYGLININPGAELTINDATGNGAIKLTATNNREWNAYSSVISNQRGKLTVNGGTIEHLGGTDMAYGIDNLTNGKGTKAETIINGGTVKSTYRAIRQFLNGTEAQNILTVNGGTIEGTNKSIWMQEANANANNGALTVAAGAAIKGDVYLFVTAGSTEWPVSVSIAAAALQGESKVVTGNVPAGYDVAEVNGTYGVYTGVAKIGTAYYETLKAAVEAAQAGETITLIDNVEASEVILLGKSLTINGNGYKVTSNATRVFRATTSNTEITLNDVNMVNTAVRVGTNDIRGISVDDVTGVKLTLNNCSVDFTDASANDWTYAVNVVGGSGHVVTVNGGAYEGANVINVRGANQTVTVKDATLTSLYPNNGLYFGACIYVVQNENSSVVATGNTFNGDNAKAFNIGYTPIEESDNIDNTKYVVAMIGDAYYTSIQAAVEAAENGETIKLTQNVKMDTKTLATQNDGYATIINVAGKAVTLDLNGKTITVNAAAADLAAAKGKMLLTVFHADTNGELTLTDNTADKAGAVVVNVNDATVYSVFASESQYSDKSESGKITVNAGNYTTVGKVANAMFFTDANEVITVNGGNFHCDQVSNTANYPWMFNTLGNNELHVTVNGGTFNIDVNHQHRPFEVKVPETLAVKANDNGTWTVVPAEAYITEMLGATVNEAGEWGHKVGYATIAEAIAAVNELGNKVSIAKDLELTEAVVVPADKTVVLDLNGKTVTMNDASGAAAVLLKNNGNLTIMDGTEAKAGKLSFKTTTPSAANAYASNTISNYGTLAIESGNVENLSVGGGACYALDNYAGSTATINGGKLTAEKTAVRIFNWTNGEEAKATINMNGGEIYSKNGYGINVNSGNAPFVALNITGGTITTDYADYKLAVYVVNKGTAENFTANVTGGTFNGIFALNGVTAQTMKQGAVAVSGGTFEGVTCYEDPAYGFVSGGTFKSVVDAKAVATGFICKDNGDGTFGVIVDPKHGMVAQIIRNDYYAENQYFATINDAVQAAVSGETVTLIADVETSAAGYATVGEENYAVIVAVKEKEITLDLNGKSVTVTPTSEELANAEGKMLMSVFGMDTNGKLTLTGNGSVKVNANGANVYSLVAAYGEGSAVVIENGNYEADAVMASGSLIYSHEMITVMGGTFKLGNLATGANGSPWIFNTIGQNYTGVKVVGGTYPTDINHQFWANEVLVPEAYALKNNGNGTWTVVDAVAYTNEKATSRGASWRHVGYASLEDAIAATGKYNCQDNTVTMIKDITLEPITVANGVKVAIDLNGKTISGTDSGTASYGLITNKGDLTINGTGAITLTATQNRGWSAYSSVISNQVGGKLTVNGGTIQHLGGTSMAYAIDNLTNGKGTYAETIINGGEIKSAYRPIRMFLNGVEADNILTVNAGTIESTGGNKAAIWMQTAGDVAHSGTLYVGADAVIKNNVYLDADNLKNVREYPVEAYIEKAALAEGMTVLADNIPAEAAALVEYDTFWQVEQKNLAELTIEDDCDEYINKIEKNVGVLTYERYFNDTEWQTLYLPFEVPVENLLADFEVAYIYNAGYKNNVARIDYVEIDENSAVTVLAANYPYLIKAKNTGWNNIVVEKAKLMPTVVNTIDCSSVFEKFVFAGNYSTLDADTLDAKKGYFDMNAGNWSRMDVLNPFRVYMQIELRNGEEFEYPTAVDNAVIMRSVNANGEATTGIDGVDAEQAGDFIFDLQGRRVLEPQKGGIYIVNGKKILF